MVQHANSRKFIETAKPTTWFKYHIKYSHIIIYKYYLGFWSDPGGQELLFHDQESYNTENTLIYSTPTKKIQFFQVL